MAKILTVRVTIDNSGKAGSCVYKNKFNFVDFKQLALLFSDLEIEGANIEKAVKEFRKQKREIYISSCCDIDKKNTPVLKFYLPALNYLKRNHIHIE